MDDALTRPILAGVGAGGFSLGEVEHAVAQRLGDTAATWSRHTTTLGSEFRLPGLRLRFVDATLREIVCAPPYAGRLESQIGLGDTIDAFEAAFGPLVETHVDDLLVGAALPGVWIDSEQASRPLREMRIDRIGVVAPDADFRGDVVPREEPPSDASR